MLRAGLLLFATLCCIAAAAQPAYKWVDERGGVHYGEKPPANVRAAPVDTQPYGVESGDTECHTIRCQGERLEADKRRQAEQEEREARLQAVTPQAPAVRGMDFNTYIRLERGMSEGELLQRAGPPDYAALDSSIYGVKKSFYYYPTAANPYTTIVTMAGGRILNLERVKKF